MSKAEKNFQNYFMKIAKPLNYYRTSLVNGSGFPDVIGFHGNRYSLVELKDIELGKRGDRKLKQLFQPTQPPWYSEYLAKGGNSLFVAWRVRDWDGSNKRYGLWVLGKSAVAHLINNDITYRDLVRFAYWEFKTCKKMIEEIEKR